MIAITGALVIGAIASIASVAGLRINTTPSFPLGLWRIIPLVQPVQTGDLVFVCPPPEQVRLGIARGYLRSGLCPGHLAPLIKRISALAGQRVAIVDRQVVIDGMPLQGSHLQSMDGQRRPMPYWSGGTLAPDTVYLSSPYPASYDSRYFGPVPAANILGQARAILTFTP